MDLLTYTEAAQLTGLTNKTLQRHVKRGTLLAVDTPVGKRIPREALAPYLGLQKTCRGQGQGGIEETSQPQGDPPQTACEDLAGRGKDDGAQGSLSVPLAAHLSALDLAKTQIEYLQRVAEEAQRGRSALEAELGKYSRVLAEQAESLAEERAWRKHLEATAAMVAPENNTPALDIGDLKADLPTAKRGFRYRLGRWLLGSETG